MLITASQNLDAAREFPFMLVRTLGLPVLTSDTPCFFENPAVLQIERTTDKGHAIVCPLTRIWFSWERRVSLRTLRRSGGTGYAASTPESERTLVASL